MKKSLFVLGAAVLLSTSAMAANWDYAQGGYQRPVNRPQQSSPVFKANANKAASPYRLGNPLYHPTAGQTVLAASASYYYRPREKKRGQDKMTGWTIDPMGEMGLTDKLSAFLSAGYGRFKVKSGPKASTYDAEIGIRYLLASADGFDFNVKAGLYYDKDRAKSFGATHTGRETGTDISLLVGKKIQSITPYFAVGFMTDFWSKRGSSTGTDTYINPGVYINLTKALSLDLNYTSVVHEDAMYRAMFDIYANRNTMFTVGGFVVHPETDNNIYGVTAGVKVGF